ncbi:MAG TPA: cupin domain-containing protein [Bauldia sp.]|nr:cupin domain-containing protein [Bauldia sp.]
MTIHQPIHADAARAPVAPPRSFLSMLVHIRSNGRDNGGLHVIETVVPSGDESPWHVHHDEDESFYVMEGELEVIVGDRRVRLGPGDFAFGPREVPHGFRVTSPGPARFLMITVGGRFADFIAEMSEPLADAVLPERAEIDLPRLVATAKKYGMDVFGPLPA